MKRQKRPKEFVRLAFLAPTPGLAIVSGPAEESPVRGARHTKPRKDRYAFLGRVRGKRWGELPAAPPAGRHTSPPRFVTDASATRESTDRRPGVVIVAPPKDFLAQLVAISLVYQHVPTCQLDPRDLAEIELSISQSGFSLNGQRVSGMLWRAPISDSNLDPLTTASWLAAASRVRAVNAYDPDAWRRGAGWSVWKDRLGDRGVPVRPPYEPGPESPETTSLVACGKVVSGPETKPIAAAATALEDSGVRLATVTALPNGPVTSVDAQPTTLTSIGARRAAARVANYIAAAA